MKNNFLSISVKFIIITLFFISCNNNDNNDLENESITISITELSSVFIKQNEYLTITGQNFIKEGEITNVVINDTPYPVTPTSNNEITIEITNEMGIENSTILIRIQENESESKDFFILPKTWYKINMNNSYDLRKSFFLKDNSIISLYDRTYDNGGSGRFIFKLDVNENGYVMGHFDHTVLSISTFSDLEMIDENIGVVTHSQGFFTTDGFETINMFGHESFSMIPSYGFITHLDETSCIIANGLGKHLYTGDSGNTASYAEQHDIFTSLSLYSARQLCAGKSSSDGLFYELGILYDDPYKNVVLSSDSYDDWNLLDSTTLFEGHFNNAQFINIDKILATDNDNNLVISNDKGVSWTIIKNDVNSFFMKSETEWYIISNDNLLLTIDEGVTWNIELELPAGSEMNHMSFSGTRILLSGKEGLLFVKQE